MKASSFLARAASSHEFAIRAIAPQGTFWWCQAVQAVTTPKFKWIEESKMDDMKAKYRPKAFPSTTEAGHSKRGLAKFIDNPEHIEILPYPANFK